MLERLVRFCYPEELRRAREYVSGKGRHLLGCKTTPSLRCCGLLPETQLLFYFVLILFHPLVLTDDTTATPLLQTKLLTCSLGDST